MVTVPAECEPWRTVVEEVLGEAADPVWDGAVPSPVDGRAGARAPLLAGATVALPQGALAGVRRRVHAATRGRARFLGALTQWFEDEASARLFEASLNGDRASMEMIARQAGVEIEAVESLAYLLPVPFLQACHRRLADRLLANRSEEFCPLCGSWPAFAEVLGIDRTRHLRCGRCGAAWDAQPLSCSFCGTSDYTDLITLVPADGILETQADSRKPEGGGRASDRGVVDACARCSRYVKRFTTLQPWPPGDVMLQDLASVALDLAAIEEGYARPAGTGHALHVTVTVL